MTDTATAHITAPANQTVVDAPAPPALPDVRPALDRSLALAIDTVAGVRPEQLTSPTPCTEFDVRGLAGHLLAAVHRITAVGRGEHFSTVGLEVDVADDGLVAAFATAADTLRDVWADDASLDRLFTLPFGTAPGRVALSMYLGEVSTHTWDLAVATGQQPAFHTADVEIALAVVQFGLPGGDREGIPFDPAQPVAPDAPVIERLVAWEGRNPAWTAAAA